MQSCTGATRKDGKRMNNEVLNNTTLECIQELGDKGAEFIIVAGQITKATSHLKAHGKEE